MVDWQRRNSAFIETELGGLQAIHKAFKISATDNSSCSVKVHSLMKGDELIIPNALVCVLRNANLNLRDVTRSDNSEDTVVWCPNLFWAVYCQVAMDVVHTGVTHRLKRPGLMP